MGTQISIKLSDKMFDTAKGYVESRGYDSIQDLIREILREKIFEEEFLSSKLTYLASEKSLSKNWLKKEEEEAWAHLQKEV